MDMPDNPFTPTFGRVPPYLAGRTSLLNDMKRAFRRGPEDPNLTSILIGAHGTGKTALLSRIAKEAQASGWITARVSARDGMLQDILERTVESGSELIDSSPSLRLKSLTLGQTFGIELDREAPYVGNWRTRMNGLLKQLEPYGTGLLITVDEVRADVDEMKQLATVYQHFIEEDKRVALIMAGLPANVSQLVSDKSVSFLRRARQRHLGRISDPDIEVALRKTIFDAGATIDDGALVEAVAAIDGFPYMMQLVGYWTWEEALSPRIGSDDVHRGVRLAIQELRDGVLATTYRELSRGDVRFLEAMLPDSGPSSLVDIAARMNVRSNYASKYKERLLDAGVLGDTGQGFYTIDLPGFKDYVRDRQSGGTSKQQPEKPV